MTLSAGARLGPYEILAPIGEGGMGEVYRARDTALRRDVAIKVLPAAVSTESERLHRFEQEARSAGMLSHPNIISVYGFGNHEGAPYVVTELLEGATLRDRMGTAALSLRRALDYAIQIANGLAAAHEKGIVHRDLKPTNIFVTQDGRIKILDFGLAKLTHHPSISGRGSTASTVSAGTEPGVILGTIGYMSPEQVRGQPADSRSDLFSFGAILYEMLCGQRAFQGGSPVDTMSAILNQEPPDLSELQTTLPPSLVMLVRRCLEKSLLERFQSARDLAYDLQVIADLPGGSTPSKPLNSIRRRAWVLGTVLGALVILGVFVWKWLDLRPRIGGGGQSSVVYHRLTFRRGNLLYARFAPDARTIVYSAAWDDKPAELFTTRTDSRESRSLGLSKVNLFSISRTGDLAIGLKKTNLLGVFGSSTLARVSLAGGAPREVLDDVWAADWSPDGQTLAVLRTVSGKSRIEFPIGKLLYESMTGVWSPRVSPKGDIIALAAPESTDGLLSLIVLDLAGKTRSLSSGWKHIETLAWHPSGREIWFSGVRSSGIDSDEHAGIFATTLGGETRVVDSAHDVWTSLLHDINRDGDVLIERETLHKGLLFHREGDPEEHDLSWLESSEVASVSSDGGAVLFSENGEGGGKNGSVYFRKADGSPAVRLGDGLASTLSQNGQWALAIVRYPKQQLFLLPTGAGEARALSVGDLTVFGAFFVDGKRIVVLAKEPSGALRGWVVDLIQGHPRAFTPELASAGAASAVGAPSPDGRLLAVTTADGHIAVCPVDGGNPRVLSGLAPGDAPIQWGADGSFLYIRERGDLPVRISRFDLSTNTKSPWKELMPADRSGLIRIESVFVTPDGKYYAYTYVRILSSDLFLVSGLR